MADNTTLKPPEKKIKTATPFSKSCTMRIMDQDSFELKDVTEASKLTGYLSPLGRKLIKKSIESNESLDLKVINQTVLEKEDGGYFHCKGQPKIGNNEDNDNSVEDVGNKESTTNDSSPVYNIADIKYDKTDSTKHNNDSKEYAVKDPFIKLDSNKAKGICLSCGVIPCKAEVYGNLLNKLAKDVAEKGKQQ